MARKHLPAPVARQRSDIKQEMEPSQVIFRGARQATSKSHDNSTGNCSETRAQWTQNVVWRNSGHSRSGAFLGRLAMATTGTYRLSKTPATSCHSHARPCLCCFRAARDASIIDQHQHGPEPWHSALSVHRCKCGHESEQREMIVSMTWRADGFCFFTVDSCQPQISRYTLKTNLNGLLFLL